MASEIDIANLALARLADTANVSIIDPPEGGTTAELVAQFLPIARDSLLQMHSWGFATKTERLARLAEKPVEWDFMYKAPTGMLRALYVRSESTLTDKDYDFDVEANASGQQVILTNADTAYVKYVEQVTDTSRFSALFVDALSWLLASHLAGPIIRSDLGRSVAQACLKTAQTLTVQAMEADVRQKHSRVGDKHLPSWMAWRRGI